MTYDEELDYLEDDEMMTADLSDDSAEADAADTFGERLDYDIDETLTEDEATPDGEEDEAISTTPEDLVGEEVEDHRAF